MIMTRLLPRSHLILLVLILGVSFAAAQPKGGNIFGTVVDHDGTPLSKAKVTLISHFRGPEKAITTDQGHFRFFSLEPSRNYALKLELPGHKTKVVEGLAVETGKTVRLILKLENGDPGEETRTEAVSPMLDSGRFSLGLSLTGEEFQALPTARDPWAILLAAPSVIVDRENIGGAESGQQPSFVARGETNVVNNAYILDGIVITDPGSSGASSVYYDFDTFSEIGITVGGSDITSQTGGVILNLVTRRGTDSLTFGGRFFYTDSRFQADNFKPELAAQGAPGINKIRNFKDYGLNFGLPLVRKTAWFWGSIGVQDIKRTSLSGNPDDAFLRTFMGKLNLQLVPRNRLEAMVYINAKTRDGFSPNPQNPEGYYQRGRYKLGTPIFKLQDEHALGGDLFLSAKYAFIDGGISRGPASDPDFEKPAIYDVTAQRYYGSQAPRDYYERPVHQFSLLANYHNDKFLGFIHDIKAGMEYGNRNSYGEYGWPGNMTIYRNFDYPTVDFDGDGIPDVPTDPNLKRFDFQRGSYTNYHITSYAFFLQDTLAFGRFTLQLGLRWDYQAPSFNPVAAKAVDRENGAWESSSTPETADKLDALLPGLTLPLTEATDINGDRYTWKTWSPRIGLTWNLTGDGKTLLKAGFNQYGDFMNVYLAGRWAPEYRGFMRFWWRDNGDNIVDWRELYWATYQSTPRYQLYRAFDDAGNFAGNWGDAYGYYWSGFDYLNPDKVTYSNVRFTAPDAVSGRTTEVFLALEREILADFAITLAGTYRKYDHIVRTLRYYLATSQIENQSWYVEAGRPPAYLPGLGSTGEAAEHEWYITAPEYSALSSILYSRLSSDRYNDYWGLDLIVNKRLSHRWMLNGSATFQSQHTRYGSKGYTDPTNLWAYEGQASSAVLGAAGGLIDQYTNARWMVKAAGLYQLPFNLNLSFTLRAREGWVIDEYFQLIDYTLPSPGSPSSGFRIRKFGSSRLPAVVDIGIRLEYLLRLRDSGRIHIIGDVFNVLNADTIIRREQNYRGIYFKYADSSRDRWVPNPYAYKINSILDPRVLRLGVRFEF